MKQSDEIKELITALNECNKEIQNPEPDADNPFYKSKYTKLSTLLNELRPILQRNGVVVMCDGFYIEPGVMEIRALISHISGQWIQRSLPIPTVNGNRSDAQTFIAALTYGRRGLISAIFNIATEEDDDGNSLVKRLDKKEVQEKLDSMNYKESVKYFHEIEKDFVSKKQKEMFVNMFAQHKNNISQAQKIENEFDGEVVK